MTYNRKYKKPTEIIRIETPAQIISFAGGLIGSENSIREVAFSKDECERRIAVLERCFDLFRIADGAMKSTTFNEIYHAPDGQAYVFDVTFEPLIVEYIKGMEELLLNHDTNMDLELVFEAIHACLIPQIEIIEIQKAEQEALEFFESKGINPTKKQLEGKIAEIRALQIIAEDEARERQYEKIVNPLLKRVGNIVLEEQQPSNRLSEEDELSYAQGVYDRTN